MSSTKGVKFYLVNENFKEIEIRRFNMSTYEFDNYEDFTLEIYDKIPKLKGKPLTIYWEDEENDKVVISSNEELCEAMREMKSDARKFFLMVKPPRRENDETEVDSTHPNIFCDGCGCQVAGYRYKCLVCKNYDLCRECEQGGVHPEHPMLRIPNPFLFDHFDIFKIMRSFSYFVPLKFESKHSRHRRRHSHDHSDSHKKRRCDKHCSGPETGEESDENCHKKNSRCIYGQLFGDIVDQLFQQQDCTKFHKEGTTKEGSREKTNEETKERPIQVKNLRSLVKMAVSLLSPIDVDLKISGGNDEESNQKEHKEKSPKSEKTKTPTAPPAEKFLFAESEKEVNEIAKILANQGISQPENDGWVSFEELKRCSEESQPSTSTEEKTLRTEKPTPWPERATQEVNGLYPNLRDEEHMPTSSVVRNALEKMLAMGFTNEGNWLAHLLEAKNGDINQALESLAPQKK